MKLSIIVPMYNAERYIDTCLNTLVKQDILDSEYEIIIINDGSTDNSVNIVKKYIQKHENINLISVKNGGQSRARNIGIENSKGKYLYFVDADDYISINSLGKVLNKTIENDVDMMFFDLKHVVNNNETKCYYNEIDNIKIKTGVEYFAENNVNNGPWHYFISNKFIKRCDIKFVEGKFCEDGMFLISSIFEAKKVAYCKVDVYRYVNRPNSTTTQKSKKHLFKMIDDFMFAIGYINEYYEKAIKNEYSNKFIKRLESRRNSYIYFMQIRMIKSKVGYKNAQEIVSRLKKMNCYKYNRMLMSEYSDLKTTIIWHILNSKNLFCILCNRK